MRDDPRYEAQNDRVTKLHLAILEMYREDYKDLSQAEFSWALAKVQLYLAEVDVSATRVRERANRTERHG